MYFCRSLAIAYVEVKIFRSVFWFCSMCCYCQLYDWVYSLLCVFMCYWSNFCFPVSFFNAKAFFPWVFFEIFTVFKNLKLKSPFRFSRISQWSVLVTPKPFHQIVLQNSKNLCKTCICCMACGWSRKIWEPSIKVRSIP